MFRRLITVSLIMVLGFGVFGGVLEAKEYPHYAYYIAGGAVLGSIILLPDKLSNDEVTDGYAKAGIVVGGFTVSFLVSACIEVKIKEARARKFEKEHNEWLEQLEQNKEEKEESEGAESGALNFIKRLYIGSSFDGKKVYAGYRTEF
jgi:hypothetical protein